jgi:uncharacterized protein YjiS (DUF1127 family)
MILFCLYCFYNALLIIFELSFLVDITEKELELKLEFSLQGGFVVIVYAVLSFASLITFVCLLFSLSVLNWCFTSDRFYCGSFPWAWFRLAMQLFRRFRRLIFEHCPGRNNQFQDIFGGHESILHIFWLHKCCEMCAFNDRFQSDRPMQLISTTLFCSWVELRRAIWSLAQTSCDLVLAVSQ